MSCLHMYYVTISLIRIQGDHLSKIKTKYMVPHSSPEVPAQSPTLCVYLMGTNGSSAYRTASQVKLLACQIVLIVFVRVTLQL